MNLTDDQKAVGKENFRDVSGKILESNPNRREFLEQATLAGAVTAGGLGAAYFGYSKPEGDRLRVGIIGTGDEGNVLIGAINPEYVEVKAIADIRPYSQYRAFHGDSYSPSALEARPGLIKVYDYADEAAAKKDIDVYSDYQELLDRDDIEAVIIALPLWIHHEAAVRAMRAGKHVLTEKLMAWDVAQCKEMARVADQTGLLLATGHQRHYSLLYDNAVDTIRRNVIGDIHHIRAQWHRGNLPGRDSWQPPLPNEAPLEDVLNMIRASRKGEGELSEAELKSTYKLVLELDAWSQRVENPDKYNIKPSEVPLWQAKVAQKRAQLGDSDIDPTKFDYRAKTIDGGYQLSAMEELIRWRLWNRTGGGLMAELGSHQLDASGIFISSQFETKDGKRTKVNPLSVSAVGGRHLFPHDREVDDHVYATYEYPGKGYYKDNDPKKLEIDDENKKVVVNYSSINGNGFGGYGEVVLGTKGTLILEREQDTMLYAGSKVDTRVTLDDKNSLVDSYETGGGGGGPAAQAVTEKVSRGYTEQIEHWAWCIRNGEPAETLHCHPKVALADAVIALTTNIAIDEQSRIEFDPDWFDPKSDAVPGGRKPAKAEAVKA